MSRFRLAMVTGLLVTGVPLFAFQDKQDPAKAEKPKESRTAYLRRIFEKDRASYGDACRAVLSVIKDEHSDADFTANVGDLSGRGVVNSEWGLQESSLLTKGTLAYMVCQALEIKGGVTMRIFGINRRYALRECIHRRLIAGGPVDEYVTGRELIDVITNATIHKEQGHTDSQYK
jgi:hypothetical protein